MSEKEYMLISEKQSVTCLQAILRDMCPSIAGVIKEKEFDEVTRIISCWGIDIFSAIEN